MPTFTLRSRSSVREPRSILKKNSGNDMAGQWRDGDGGGRSRHRSSSTPPDSRHHHHDRRPQDVQTGLTPVNAGESWAWGQSWAKTFWGPGRTQVQVQSQVRVTHQEWVVRGGQPGGQGRREGDRGDRGGRRSSDLNRRPPTPAPALRRMSLPATAEPPVIPGVTVNAGGMGFRNLLRKSSRNRRPKILFYNKNEPYYGFTNFSPHSVTYRGKRYPTSEHLFQSLKFTHKPGLMEHIRTCDPRPSVAFAEARRFAHEVRPDWKHDNINAMDLALYHKFTQHRDLRRELLATGDAELIENSDKDPFWGCGADGKGRNELGKALERLRRQLRGQGGW